MDFRIWTETLSLSVAPAAFVLSLWTKRKDEREAVIRGWQRVVIYAAIEDGGGSVSFDDLKSKYLQKVLQLTTKIPHREIQDDALRRILLDLQKDGVVVRTENAAYQVQLKAQNDSARLFLRGEVANGGMPSAIGWARERGGRLASPFPSEPLGGREEDRAGKKPRANKKQSRRPDWGCI